MQSEEIKILHKVCASEANGLTNVQSEEIKILHKVCASEANGLANVQSDKIQKRFNIMFVHLKLMD